MKRILAGPHAVLEALRAKPGAIAWVVYAAPLERSLDRTLDEVRRLGARVEPRATAEVDVLSRGLRHQGIVAVAGDYPYQGIEACLALPPRSLIVALDEITDPHNFGAIVRSAVALGAGAVVTLRDRAAPVTPVVVRASAGATEHATIVRVTNLARTLSTLRDDGFTVLGLAGEGSVPLGQASLSAERGVVLVVGSEGTGLRPLVRKGCDAIVSIPLRGPIESLNASVAAGIAIHSVMASLAE